MNIAPRRQHIQRPDQITARNRLDILAAQRAHQAVNLGFLLKQMVDLCARFAIQVGHDADMLGPLRIRDRTTHNMQPIRDQRIFGFQQLQPQRLRVAIGQINGLSLRMDQVFQLGPLARIRGKTAPTGQAVFQLRQTFVQPPRRQRRRQMCDRHSPGPTLGQGRLGRVVGGIEIDVRQLTNQAVWPITGPKARLLARHELKRTMHPKMQDHISLVLIAEPQIKRRERMGGGKAGLKQKTHRIAFVPKRGLHPDEDIAKMLTQNKDAPPVGLHFTRRGTPNAFDCGKRRGRSHDRIGIHVRRNIGLLTVLLGITLKDRGAQNINAFGNIYAIALRLHGVQSIVEALKNAEVCSGSNGTSIRRKAK